jgi:hypothetical protein
MTPRTQKVTSTDVHIVRRFSVRRTAASRRAGWDRHAVADDDCVAIDEHFLDDQAHNALALGDVEAVGRHS